MKPRISRLTLELYHRGLATRKERKMVEKALLADISVRERYETLIESEHEINQLVSKELTRLNFHETPTVHSVHSVHIVWIIAVVAVLTGTLVPAFLYKKSHNSNKENIIIEETVHETETLEIQNTDYILIDDKEFTPEPEQPIIIEMAVSNTQTRITENPRGETVSDKEIKPKSADFQSGSYTISIVPADGEDGAIPIMQESDKDIPAGITSISENMFAYKFLGGIFIPDRIRSIAKNAYEGNPALVVTIGANVDVHDEAIPGNFAKAYNSFGKSAGTYIRFSTYSEDWVKDFLQGLEGGEE
jgi:hypothetical protein